VISLRDFAKKNKIPANFSVIEDLFGYKYRGHRGPLSLRQHISLIRMNYVDLNLILVHSHTNSWIINFWRWIDRAVEVARNLFAQIPLGINHIYRYQEKSSKFSVIKNGEEARRLTTKYNGEHSNAMDCFFVSKILEGTVVGYGPSPYGPAPEEKHLYCWQGVVVSLSFEGLLKTFSSIDKIGIILAHEIGHYFGLPHRCEEFPDTLQELLEEFYNIPLKDCGIISNAPWCGVFDRMYVMYPSVKYIPQLFTPLEGSIILQQPYVIRGP
jgi:hypothetical protein